MDIIGDKTLPCIVRATIINISNNIYKQIKTNNFFTISVSKTSNVIGEDCPSIINGIYGNNTSDGSNSNICYSGFINSSHTSPQLSIYVDSSCMNDFGKI